MSIISWLGFLRGGDWKSFAVILKFLNLPKCAIIFLSWHQIFHCLLAPHINDNFCFCYFEMVTLSSLGCPGTFYLNTSGLQTCHHPASISWELRLLVFIMKPGLCNAKDCLMHVRVFMHVRKTLYRLSSVSSLKSTTCHPQPQMN